MRKGSRKDRAGFACMKFTQMKNDEGPGIGE